MKLAIGVPLAALIRNATICVADRPKASVAASAPMTSTKEFTTPFQNNDQAGAVLSIGSNSSMPVDDANQFSKSVTLSAKPVGCSAALSAGRTQAGLVLPVPVLHSGC